MFFSDCTSSHLRGNIRIHLPGVTWITLQQESLHRHKDARIPPAEKESAKKQQDTRHARDPVGDVSVERCTGEHQGARKDDIQQQRLGLAAAAPALGEPVAEAVAQQTAHKPGEGPGDDDGDARQADQRELPARGEQQRRRGLVRGDRRACDGRGQEHDPYDDREPGAADRVLQGLPKVAPARRLKEDGVVGALGSGPVLLCVQAGASLSIFERVYFLAGW